MSSRRFVCAVLVLLLAAVPVVRRADAAGATPLFRVFLKDGTPLVCWGEYARVGDQLVLTVPVGQGARTTYEFVSIPVGRVDMVRTERYAEAVRAAQFAASRGGLEYAALSDRLAEELSVITTLSDPKVRLATAERAREELIQWAEGSHGYRAKEVQQLLQMFDSVIVDLRVAAGESRFSINLSGGLMPPVPAKLRADPTARDTIELALKAASVADAADSGRALLRRARAALSLLSQDDPRTVDLRGRVDRALAEAVRIDVAYRRLELDVRRLAASAVDRGDVTAIEKLRERVTRTDRLLGRQRREVTTALLDTLNQERDAAAQQRLVLDHWESLRAEVVEYQRHSAVVLKTLDALVDTLTAIRDMSGPPLTSLVRDEGQTAGMVALFAELTAPETASAAHSLLGLAVDQADLAVRTRHRAIDTRQLSVAREASAAAADALTRLSQSKVALAAALKPPKAIR